MSPRKTCFTLKEFRERVLRDYAYWPVGAKIEMDDGSIYTVGQVNPLLQTSSGTLDERKIAFVHYKG